MRKMVVGLVALGAVAVSASARADVYNFTAAELSGSPTVLGLAKASYDIVVRYDVGDMSVWNLAATYNPTSQTYTVAFGGVGEPIQNGEFAKSFRTDFRGDYKFRFVFSDGFSGKISSASITGPEITTSAVPGPVAGSGVISVFASLGLGLLLRRRLQQG